LLCSWILAPGGQAGGFQEVTLIFTQFLLTSEDAVSVYSCFDINCTDRSTALKFKGSTAPAPCVSSTPVVFVELTRVLQTFATSAGFTASFAGTPLVPAGLQVGVWHHIAWAIAPRGTYTLFVNGTQERAEELPLDPNSTKSALVSGRFDLALGRGAPDWQDGGDFGYGCIAIDELRIWTSERSSMDIMSNVFSGCVVEDTRALLAVCYGFDEVSSSETGDFFAEVSQNSSLGLFAAAGASYLPWCVNVDDEGELRLDSSTTTDLWSGTKMWGQCISKPRLPGAGFNYIETEMQLADSRFC